MTRTFLLFLIIFPNFAVSVEDKNECAERCSRLKQRSLNRVGYDDERLLTLFERQRPLRSMKDVCWRLYDNIDCMKKCPKSEEHAKFAKMVRNKCKFVLKDMEPTLKCISKHQSFLKMRCSSFLNEASRLRSESDLSTTPRHEECRFLHLNTICLENHVNSFCKNGKNIFKRLNFRDYFLSFALPKDDDLFDDEDLDSCQIYDFVKDAEKREREEEERRLEEEKRRRIEDDEDYDEELTTIVNDLEDDIEYTTSTQSTTTPITTTLATITESEEFTSLIDELIDSAEAESPTKTTNDVETTEENGSDYEAEDYAEDSTPASINVVRIESRSSSTEQPARETHSSTNKPVESTTTNSEDLTTYAIHLTPPVDQEDEIGITTPLKPLEQTTHPIEKGDIVETTTPKRRVFSEDSMENTPPNFFYSSVRGWNLDSTTRSNYVVDNLDNQDSEEPLVIDTSTLFGIETTTSEEESTPSEEMVTDEITTQLPKTSLSPAESPWLHGGVIVKPILDFGQKDIDDEEERERKHRERLENQYHPDLSSDLDLDVEEPSSSSSTDTIIVIGLISIVTCLLIVILLFCLVYYCTSARRSATYNVQKNCPGTP